MLPQEPSLGACPVPAADWIPPPELSSLHSSRGSGPVEGTECPRAAGRRPCFIPSPGHPESSHRVVTTPDPLLPEPPPHHPSCLLELQLPVSPRGIHRHLKSTPKIAPLLKPAPPPLSVKAVPLPACSRPSAPPAQRDLPSRESQLVLPTQGLAATLLMSLGAAEATGCLPLQPHGQKQQGEGSPCPDPSSRLIFLGTNPLVHRVASARGQSLGCQPSTGWCGVIETHTWQLSLIPSSAHHCTEYAPVPAPSPQERKIF